MYKFLSLFPYEDEVQSYIHPRKKGIIPAAHFVSFFLNSYSGLFDFLSDEMIKKKEANLVSL